MKYAQLYIDIDIRVHVIFLQSAALPACLGPEGKPGVERVVPFRHSLKYADTTCLPSLNKDN
jgi:hypothetical protein